MRWVFVRSLFVLMLGCGPAPRTAADVRAELADALVAGDETTLARLLELEALPEGEPERAEVGQALAEAELVERGWAFAGDRAVLLVREADGWRVDRGLLGAPVLATPEEALRAFGVALRRMQRSGAGAVLSRHGRGLVTEELDRWSRGLADPAALSITVTGATASVVLPTGVVIELVEEAGEWRVDDVHE